MKKLVLVVLSVICAASISVAQPPKAREGRHSGEHKSVKERVEFMKKALVLTDEQCEQVKALENERKPLKEKSERPSREEMQKKHEAHKVQMKEILNDAQYKKYEKMLKRQSNRGPQKKGKARR